MFFFRRMLNLHVAVFLGLEVRCGCLNAAYCPLITPLSLYVACNSRSQLHPPPAPFPETAITVYAVFFFRLEHLFSPVRHGRHSVSSLPHVSCSQAARARAEAVVLSFQLHTYNYL